MEKTSLIPELCPCFLEHGHGGGGVCSKVEEEYVLLGALSLHQLSAHACQVPVHTIKLTF